MTTWTEVDSVVVGAYCDSDYVEDDYCFNEGDWDGSSDGSGAWTPTPAATTVWT